MEIQSPIYFFVLEKTPTMYILRESWDLGDFENLKIFEFFVSFASKMVFEGFDGFWPNRPTDIKYIGFWKFLRVNCAIFDILEPKRQRLWKYGFWRFFMVFSGFLAQKVKFQIFKIFKIGQKFDFHKIGWKYHLTSYKRGKWFFRPPRPYFR